MGFVLGSLLTAHAFAADDADLSAEMRVSYWTRDRALAVKDNIPAASLWVKGAAHFDDAWSGNLEMYIVDDRLLKQPNVEARKAYLRWQSTKWDIRVGRQIEPWGRSDILTPTDNLGSWNYTALFPNDDDQRQGLFMARADYLIDTYKLEAVWLPEFRPTVYPLPAAFKSLLASQSSDRWRVDQFAAKVDQSGEIVDWSISWFHGLDRTFSLSLLPSVGTGGGITQIYPTIDVVGADAATAISGIGLRGEIAYIRLRMPKTLCL